MDLPLVLFLLMGNLIPPATQSVKLVEPVHTELATSIEATKVLPMHAVGTVVYALSECHSQNS